jgi:hypothetical protein
MENATYMLIALVVCFILPIVIVWLALRARKHEVDRKAEVLLKAMEAGIPIDQELLKPQKNARSVKQGLLDRFTGACVTTAMGAAFILLYFFIPNSSFSRYPGVGGILLAIGIALFVAYFAGKKMLAQEIEEEEKRQ